MKKLSQSLVLIFITVLFLFVDCKAQWVGVGGPSGEVSVIVTKGDTVICADEYGVYRSFDEGTSWITINNGIQNKTMKAIAFMGDTIYAGSYPEGRLYMSNDYGVNWTLVNSFQHSTQIYGIWSLATKDSIIYVGTGRGLFVSTDKGLSWNQPDSSISKSAVLSIFFYNNEIFIGTLGMGVFKSTDKGFTWQSASIGLESTNKNIYSFCSINNNIFLGTSSGIFSSTNDGTNWNLIHSDSLYNIPYQARQYLFTKGNILFAASGYSLHSIIMTLDSGTSWALADSGLDQYTNISSLAASNNYVLAGTDTGICRTNISNINWEYTSAGSRIMSFGGKEIANSNPYIYAGTIRRGVFLSNDNGKTWRNTGLNRHAIYSFLFNGNNLYAAAGFDASGYPLAGGIFLSTDNGIDWSEVDNGLNDGTFNYYINKLSVDGNDILAGTQWGLFKSANNGINWAAAGLDNKFIKQIFVTGSYIIAATMDSVFRSIDDGMNWNKISNGLPSGSIYSMTEISTSGNSWKLFLGTQYGVFSSTNGGLNWDPAGLDTCSVLCMAKAGNNIFAGTDYSHGRVFVSTDEGLKWTQISDNLNYQDITSLYVIGNYIFTSAGYNGGIWRRPLSEVITSVKPQQTKIPNHFYLNQNFPNPFNPTTTISYEIPQKSFVTIKIYDLLGREVTALVNEEEIAGSHSVNFNAQNLSSGVYFYSVNAGGFNQTKKMVLLK